MRLLKLLSIFLICALSGLAAAWFSSAPEVPVGATAFLGFYAFMALIAALLVDIETIDEAGK